MTSKLRIFVCEFITGGGLYNAPLPDSLAREGDAMLQALLADLLELPDMEVMTTRDPRLPHLGLPLPVKTAGDDVWSLWKSCIAEADAFWPIAPESGGALEKLSALAGRKRLVGCAPESIRIAASKRMTAMHLAGHGIRVVPTFLPSEFVWREGRYVAKPDDGAGCEDTRLFDDPEEMNLWLQGRRERFVIQPWIEGEAASLSMICHDGKACLLSCNRQMIEVAEGTVHYRGSLVNGAVRYWDEFEVLAGRVAAAMPGLAGYVGVDLMAGASGFAVLEVNPRLTTSYAGLRRATGANTAGLVLDLLYNGHMAEADKLQRNTVEIRIDG